MTDPRPAGGPVVHGEAAASTEPVRAAPRVPIRRKLVAMIAGVAAGALLLSFAMVLVQDVVGFRRAAVAQARLVARLVGDSTVSDLAFDDREAATQRLAQLAGVPGIEGAFLYDTDGELFASWGRAAGAGDLRLHEPAGVALGDGILRVVEPVTHRDVPRGALRLEASTSPLEAQLVNRLLTLAALLVALVAIAIAAAARLQRLVSEPILELAAATETIRRTGDLSLRVGRRGADEIGILYERFDDLLGQLELQHARRDAAEQRTQEKSRFLANMSHELRTPLNSIIGFSEILIGRLDGRTDAREAKFLRNIHASGRHLLDVINDILDLSKVEAGRMEIRPEPVLVPPLLDGMATLMRGVAEPRRVAIEVEAASDLPPLHADPVRAKQILYNLLSNAVKFSAEGGTVRVAARHVAALGPSGAVELAVRDQGIGIAAADQERIFDAFWQVDGGPARHFGGTGLGLALVKTFVDLHGGRVTVESAVGRGSTFTVLLPAAPRPAPARPAAEADA